jgi:hypothetical protein
MNPSQSSPAPKPEPNGSQTENLLSVYCGFDDSTGDFTVRPMRSPNNIRIRHDQPPPTLPILPPPPPPDEDKPT